MPVEVDGELYYLDVGFVAERVALEVDSWEFHGGRRSFGADRRRHNALAAAGWTVLHVTPAMLEHSPDHVLRWVQDTLTRRRRIRPTAARGRG